MTEFEEIREVNFRKIAIAIGLFIVAVDIIGAVFLFGLIYWPDVFEPMTLYRVFFIAWIDSAAFAVVVTGISVAVLFAVWAKIFKSRAWKPRDILIFLLVSILWSMAGCLPLAFLNISLQTFFMICEATAREISQGNRFGPVLFFTVFINAPSLYFLFFGGGISILLVVCFPQWVKSVKKQLNE